MLSNAIRKSLSLKVTLLLAAITVVLTALVAVFIISHETSALEAAMARKSELSAQLGAQAYGRLLDEGIDNGYLTPLDVFDRNYEEIKGYDWGPNPKYHTRYDFYTDRVALRLQDGFLITPDFSAAIGSDVNGYVPTHNSRYQQPVTGDAAKDLEGNRTKRIFKNDVVLNAGKSEAPFLLQDYQRDTGERVWSVSAPVYVKGKHWGCFRILVSLDAIAKQRATLIWQLVLIFGVFAAITSAAIFLMIRRAMKPLVALSALADELSTGEGLENPIRTNSIDEVGVMSKSVDRLRSSLKSAMARLGE